MGFFSKWTRKLRKKNKKVQKRTSSNKTSSPELVDEEFKKVAKKYNNTIKELGISKKDVAELSKKIDDLETLSKKTFKKTRKHKNLNKSPSPLLITITNLDTGKKVNASVIKNLNKNAYEFIELDA